LRIYALFFSSFPSSRLIDSPAGPWLFERNYRGLGIWSANHVSSSSVSVFLRVFVRFPYPVIQVCLMDCSELLAELAENRFGPVLKQVHIVAVNWDHTLIRS
jgi:hypothetical protein